MPSENFDRRGRAQTKQRDRSIRDRNCFIFRVQSIRVALPPFPPSPWFEWLANEEDNENREKMIPRNHCARTFQRLSLVSHCAKSSNPRLAPFWWKIHATDLNYDCHTSCVSPVMMKGRINSIRCVFRVTNRGRNTSFAYFMAEAWRIRVKLRENLYEVFIRPRFDDVQLLRVYHENQWKLVRQ